LFSWLAVSPPSYPTFNLAVISDTQFGSFQTNDNTIFQGVYSKSYTLYESRYANNLVANAIKSWRAQQGAAFAGLFVNGDLTAEGSQGKNNDDFQSIYQANGIGNVFWGFGNHDFQKPLNDGCGASGGSQCAEDMRTQQVRKIS
jgi:hypothetical protein